MLAGELRAAREREALGRPVRDEEPAGRQVVAGPFKDAREARETVRRLKIDLEIDGRVIEPVRRK